MKTLFNQTLTILILSHLTMVGFATSHTWTGAAGTSDWNDATNWTGGIPSSNGTTEVTIPTLANGVYPTLDPSITNLKSLTVNQGASLDIGINTVMIEDVDIDGGTINSNRTAGTAPGVIQSNNASGINASFLSSNNAIFHCQVSAQSSQGVSTNGLIQISSSTFMEPVDLAFRNTGQISSAGGNSYHKFVRIEYFGSSAADKLELASTASNTYYDDVIFHHHGSGNSIFSIATRGTGGNFYGTTTFSAPTDGRVLEIAKNASNITFHDDVIFNVNDAVAGTRKVELGENATGKIYFDGNIIITATNQSIVQLGYTGQAELELANGKQLLQSQSGGISGNSSLILESFKQLGTTSQSLILGGTTELVLGTGTRFEGQVNFQVPRIKLNGTSFNSNCLIEQTGPTNTTSLGGNIFNGSTTIIRSNASGRLDLASNAPDDYNHDVTYRSPLSGSISPAHGQLCTYAGHISLDIPGINFGTSTGGAKFDGQFDQNIVDVYSGTPTASFRELTLEKAGGSLLPGIHINVTKNATFNSGTIKTGQNSLLIFNDGSTAASMKNTSHVQGPIKKIGDEAFVFPTGDNGKFLPIGIGAPNNAADEFTAEFHDAYHNESADPETLTSLGSSNYCEHWTLVQTGAVGSGDNVAVSLGYTPLSCNIPYDITTYQVAHKQSASSWANLGQSGISTINYAGTPANSGLNLNIVNSSNSVTVDFTVNAGGYHKLVLASTEAPEDLPIYGFSLNNYGAVVRINGPNTFLNVRGNIYAGKGSTPTGGTIRKGQFRFQDLDSWMSLTRDWLNESNGVAVISNSSNEPLGTVEFNGEHQRILGSDPNLDKTVFQSIYLRGNFKKDMYIDAWVRGNLTLDRAELAVNKSILVLYGLHQDQANQITASSTGFISTNHISGKLRIFINTYDLIDTYFLPLGSSINSKKIRPLRITTTDFNTTVGAFDLRFVANDVDQDNMPRLQKLPHIPSINSDFYYQIDHISTSNGNVAGTIPNLTLTPPTLNTTGIDFKFDYIQHEDGIQTMLCHWEDGSDPTSANIYTTTGNSAYGGLGGQAFNIPNSTNYLWTSVNNSTVSTSLTNGSTGYKRLEVNNLADFGTKNFALCEQGIVVGTGNFGSTGGGNVTITATGSGTFGTGTTGGNTVGTNGSGSGTVVINVNGNQGSTGGKIKIPINSNGLINTGSGNPQNGPTIEIGGTDVPVDPEVLDISATGVNILSVPKDLDKNCSSGISVITTSNPSSTTNGYTLDYSTNSNARLELNIDQGMPDGTYVFNYTGSAGAVNLIKSGSTAIQSSQNLSALPEGAYAFTIETPDSDFLNGQFIIKK